MALILSPSPACPDLKSHTGQLMAPSTQTDVAMVLGLYKPASQASWSPSDWTFAELRLGSHGRKSRGHL